MSAPYFEIVLAIVAFGQRPRDVEEAMARLDEALTEEASLTFGEAARVLSVSTNTLNAWIDQGFVPARTFPGNKR